MKWLQTLCLAVSCAGFAAMPVQTQSSADQTIIEATGLRSAGRPQDAEILVRSALTESQQSKILDIPTANLMNRLGIILQDEGRFPEAEACFRQAAADLQKLLDPQDSQIAFALTNLGGLLVEEGRYQEAYSLIRRALDIAIPALGDCHPEVALMYSGLSRLFYRQHETARALPNARRALWCLEKQGVQTVELGDNNQNLAVMYLEDGQYSLAQEHLDRANAIWARLLPRDHPNVLYGTNTQVMLYYKQGRYQEARELGLQSVDQVRKKLGPKYPALVVMLANIGYSDRKLRLYREAAEYFQEAISIEEAVNRQDPYLAELLSSYAAVLRQEHRKPEAKQLELRAKAILANSVR